ncbi:twin-arginine translocase subunit TatC [Chryseobacterium lacus]|uniref:Sec-independent protein translocase protein TatC n=1 Tax=Chryseobacterium lacus TaxID=2058346 RepID=A0A368MYH6_9FLAO|nr:twin-arginine translocase subunit TatC [Chryseobacterium lacus]RST26668.1 twin-arginine translocase subunit TatC [Chryseobacterium lacus]
MEEKDMSFMGHIGELRGHLIRCIIAIIACGLIVGFNINWIIDHIFFGPVRNDFPTFRVVNSLSRYFTGDNAIELPDDFPVRVQKLYQQFNVMMSVSFLGGMVLAFPYIVWELWRFVSPALHPREKKNSMVLINSVWILFLTGIMVGYFLILPFAINFAVLFKISDIIQPLYDLSDYTALFFQIVLGMGAVFLFPVIVYFLTTIGILTPQFLKTYRRHAIVLIMVIAAVITPADVVSMMIAAVPLLLLFEFSIGLSHRTYRRLEKAKLSDEA